MYLESKKSSWALRKEDEPPEAIQIAVKALESRIVEHIQAMENSEKEG